MFETIWAEYGRAIIEIVVGIVLLLLRSPRDYGRAPR